MKLLLHLYLGGLNLQLQLHQLKHHRLNIQPHVHAARLGSTSTSALIGTCHDRISNARVPAQVHRQAQLTKVKLSSRDFVLRKKKQLEEMELGLVQASPLSVSSTLGAEDEGEGDAEVGTGADGGRGPESQEEKAKEGRTAGNWDTTINGEDSDASTSVDVNSNVTNLLHVDAYVQREIIQRGCYCYYQRLPSSSSVAHAGPKDCDFGIVEFASATFNVNATYSTSILCSSRRLPRRSPWSIMLFAGIAKNLLKIEEAFR